MSLHDPGNLV